MTVSVNDNMSLDPWGLGGSLPGDWYDNDKMNTPGVKAETGQSWWQDLVKYGATRAIDNAFASKPIIAGNTDTGSFAGSNGLTYSQDLAQRGNQNALNAQTAGLFGGGSNTTLALLMAVGLGFVLFKAMDGN